MTSAKIRIFVRQSPSLTKVYYYYRSPLMLSPGPASPTHYVNPDASDGAGSATVKRVSSIARMKESRTVTNLRMQFSKKD